MSQVAGFLVVLNKNVHPDQVELTIAAVRQLHGVAGVRTMFDDAGHEIEAARTERDEIRASTAERARQAGL